jgi:hypothetical protein
MQSAWGLLFLGACIASLTGCGDDASRPSLGSVDGQSTSAVGGSSGTAGSSSNASGAGGSIGGSVSSAGGGGSTGGSGSVAPGPVDCEDLKDDKGWQLMIEIKNEMSQTLYLGPEDMNCEARELFQVQDGARRALPALAACRSSCQNAMTGTSVSCPLVCPIPTTVTLDAGQSVRVPWDGRFAVPQTLPQQCVSGAATPAAECVSAEQVEAGVFTFSAKAGTTRRCLDPSGTCNCGPSAIGGCSTPTSLIGGTIVTTELFMMLEPGEPSPNGAPPLVSLTFRDQNE